ncbi:Peptidoglycan/LPS O-acetylase OafA/YrhL, contains acyltransferase and SGNH-hydrolase domains [Nonomuraea solani]|uniref:Peptidoglycan/LPS O-acetylase OafA/YrhL, contains acyltransferase and SGNH-hydrolase domains n=1 Tax=Nonomuraea solani TaxID=1144553 RepID=A0A1H6CKR8_9ACTN|nr:acyltransferase [Nonomuraea solani]SEG73508.1 Peptidoglycan/LPS O-acetylase OafA/YrhL, contains acyltransferase and SGNH-hydrolase domains [Nonomuraea solani]
MAGASALPTDSGSSRANAFNLLRLLGALAVVVEHSWVLSGHGTPLTPASGIGAGGIGVGVFFLISGYLISASWLSDPSPARYTLRRVLRIYPAYALVVVLTALLLGPLVSTLPAADYFAASGTWGHIVRGLLIQPVSYTLPGVFEGLPYAGAVNGSLWTIWVEVLCYAGVAVMGLLGLLRRRAVLAGLVVVALAATTVIHLTGYAGPLVPLVVSAFAAQPLAFFALGMLIRELRWVPPVWLTAVLLVVWPLLWGTPPANLGAIAAITCVTFLVAFRAPAALHRPTGSYDLSYGAYLLAFPAQQVLVLLGLREPWLVLLATTAIVLPLAALSWRLVEAPALRLRRRKPVAVPP